MMEKISVLIIEDDPVLSGILRSVLESDATDVAACANGHHALDLINRKKFDVFITDYRLPGMSGADIVKNLRLAYPESRIIGMSIQNYDKEFREAGADAFLLKPFDIEDLLLSIR